MIDVIVRLFTPNSPTSAITVWTVPNVISIITGDDALNIFENDFRLDLIQGLDTLIITRPHFDGEENSTLFTTMSPNDPRRLSYGIRVETDWKD